jgi:thioredoxin 1
MCVKAPEGAAATRLERARILPAYGGIIAHAAAAPDMENTYTSTPPNRAEVDALPGITLLEFGTPWCGHCRRAQPLIAQALAGHRDVRHLKIEDGPGRRLGRSFGVKLWPTLVVLVNGREVGRMVRPGDAEAIGAALERAGP